MGHKIIASVVSFLSVRCINLGPGVSKIVHVDQSEYGVCSVSASLQTELLLTKEVNSTHRSPRSSILKTMAERTRGDGVEECKKVFHSLISTLQTLCRTNCWKCTLMCYPKQTPGKHLGASNLRVHQFGLETVCSRD